MAVTEPHPAAASNHPFTAALARRDIDALVEALAPDAVLHSAVTNTPFEGRDVLRDLYSSLFEAFEELRVTDQFEQGATRVFFWEGQMDGRYVAGADRLRLNTDGKVDDITIVGRPLTGLASFLTGLGFHFARRRRGPVAARALRLGALPLPALFRLIDALTRWLVRGPGARPS